MIDDVAKLMSTFTKDYKATYASVDDKDRPKILFIIDSLGMLLTPTDVNQFEAGDLKGDMGRKPKALAALLVAATCTTFGAALSLPLFSITPGAGEWTRHRARRPKRSGSSRAPTVASGSDSPPTFPCSQMVNRCSASTSPMRAARSGAALVSRRRLSLRSTTFSALAGRLLRRRETESLSASARRETQVPVR